MGVVFALFAGYYYWVSKLTGRDYNELLGQIHFWTLFVGANLTFFPMHFLGISGMPRRIPDYPDIFYMWNSVSSYGSIISSISTIIFIYSIFELCVFELNAGVKRTNWNIPSFFNFNTFNVNYGSSLEWVLPSPPKFHTYNHLPMM